MALFRGIGYNEGMTAKKKPLDDHRQAKRLMKLGLVFIIPMVLYIGFRLWQPSDSYAHFRKGMKVIFGKNSNALVDEFLPRPGMPTKDVSKYELERLADSEGLVGADNVDKYIEGGNPAQTTLAPGQVSNFQSFVTPEDPVVQELAAGKTPEEIYAIALRWIWIEDQVLNGVPEKWLLPRDLLTLTPNMRTNPNPGRVSSDCESQAYSLVSALRAAGVPPEYVRVVLGQVNFNGVSGGHAWVELYDDEVGEWFQLEATSGSYYNSAQRQLYESEGLPFNYYRKYQYPSVEIWNYFNDEYFWDNKRQQGTIPENWLTGEAKKKQIQDENVKYTIPDRLKKLREDNDKIVPLPDQQGGVKLRFEKTASPEAVQEAVPLSPAPTPVYAAYQAELLTALEAVEDAGLLTGAARTQAGRGAEEIIRNAEKIIAAAQLSGLQQAEAARIVADLRRLVVSGMTQREKTDLQNRIAALE